VYSRLPADNVTVSTLMLGLSITRHS